jgi:hypothetical protein
VRIDRKLTNRGVSVLLLLELDDTSSTRAAVRLVLNLSALDLADSGEELDEILVTGWPWQVADVDGVAGLSTRSSEICEGVGWVWTSRLEPWATGARSTTIASSTSSKASTSTEASPKAAAGTETSSATEATCEASTSTETTATAKATRSTSEAIFADLEVSALPLIAVELVNGVSRIVYGLESYYARALGTTIGGHVDIGAEDRSGVSSLTEQIFEILPANVVWKLGATVSNYFFYSSTKENRAQTLAT